MQVIAIGVLRDRNTGCYFIGMRPNRPTFDLPNTWEFPGGKREDGETVETALIRELKEELSITGVKLGPALMTCVHPLRDDMVLHFILVEDWEGTPQTGPEHTLTRWVTPLALRTLKNVTTFAVHYAMELAETVVSRRK